MLSEPNVGSWRKGDDETRAPPLDARAALPRTGLDALLVTLAV
jgi:hypothetical protein